MAPALLFSGGASYHRSLFATRGGVSKFMLPLLWLLLSPLPGSDRETAGPSQLRFGIEVAQKGLWQEARFRFEKAVELNPDSAQAQNDLAIALEQQGEFEKARAAYEKALKLKPGDVYIQQNYDLFREADDKRNRKSKKRP
jgi:Tfp pilus assembly protein PilF